MSAAAEPQPSATASFRSAIRFDPGRAVVANVASRLSTTVFVVCLDVSQTLAEHRAPSDLTLLVIEGQPTITVDDTAMITTTGDVIVVAAGTLHSLTAGSQRAVVVGVLHRQRKGPSLSEATSS